MDGLFLDPLDPLEFLHFDQARPDPPANPSATQNGSGGLSGEAGAAAGAGPPRACEGRIDERSAETGQKDAGPTDARPFLPTPSPSSLSTHTNSTASEQRDAPLPGVSSSPILARALPLADIEQEDTNELSDDSLSSADSEIARAVSPSARRTVLFADHKTFSSKVKFIASAKRRVHRSYGVRAWLHQNEEHRALVVCSRRPCRFRVRAERVSGGTGWAVLPDKCVWEHSHDPEGDGEGYGSSSGSEEEESESGSEDKEENSSRTIHSRKAPARGRRRPQTTTSVTSSAIARSGKVDIVEIDSSASSGDKDEVFDSESDDEQTSSSGKSIHVPGLPTPSDRFASTDDAYVAYVRALIPVYGIGVTRQPTSSGVVELKCNKYFRPSGGSTGACPWTAILTEVSKSKRWRVDFDRSCFDHSHGPAWQILEDPSWRPIVRNPAAREALGMDPSVVVGSGSGADGLHVAQDATKEREERKRRRDCLRDKGKGQGAAVKSKGKERAHDVSPSLKKQRRRHSDGTFATRVAPPHHNESSAFALAQPSTSQGSSFLYGRPGARTFPCSPAFPPPHPNPSFSGSFATPSTSREAPSSVSLPTSAIEAFLYGLHPTLASLAPHLVAGAFTTIDSLVSLAFLEPATLDHVLDQLRHNAELAYAPSSTAPQPPSVIQLRLLARLLREAGRV